MKSYSYLIAGIFLLYEASYVVETAEPWPIDNRGLCEDINNVTAAVQLVTDATTKLLDAFKENKLKKELRSSFEGVIMTLKELCYSKDAAESIPFSGMEFRAMIEGIEEGLQGLPKTENLMLQFCSKDSQGSQTKQYVVDPDVKKNFYGAVEYCQAKKLELATIDSEKDLKNVMEVLNKTCDGSSGRFWTSGSKLGDGHWKWLTTGKKIPFFKWGEGEPNNIGGQQNCLEFYVNYYKTGMYDDAECHYEFPPVCQTK